MELGKRTGGKDYRQHQTLKQYVRERDNYTCQLCGLTKDQVGQMDVDHIVPWHISHDSSLDNLRCLCHSCNLIGRRHRQSASLPLADWWASIEAEVMG